MSKRALDHTCTPIDSHCSLINSHTAVQVAGRHATAGRFAASAQSSSSASRCRLAQKSAPPVKPCRLAVRRRCSVLLRSDLQLGRETPATRCPQPRGSLPAPPRRSSVSAMRSPVRPPPTPACLKYTLHRRSSYCKILSNVRRLYIRQYEAVDGSHHPMCFGGL
jgi:hypothetical protein